MPIFSQDEITKIRNSASIVEIISSYIPLTPKGKNYFGICPFHEDHSPSMSVSEEKQIYKCFSCGATGNVFSFVENYLNIGFAEAVKVIADRVGIHLEQNIGPQKEVKNQKEYELYDFTAKLYQNNLNSENGYLAKEYLNSRGISEEIIDEFGIGLSFSKNVLYTILKEKNYADDFLNKMGLLGVIDGNVSDIFQNRIMFPIDNLEGKVVGFTARAYKENIKPKYINSKETNIFKKGNILFNYHRAKDEARLLKQLIVVEGNMDAIRLYASGIKNVVALMGTSLTKEQIEVLKKLRVKLIMMLDNDSAGEIATYNIGKMLEDNNIDFLIVRLSDAKDPDEYVLKFGVDAIKETIKKAISFMDFKLNYLKKNKNLNDAADLASYIKEVLKSIENNNDEILKEVTLQKLSNDYNISYAVLKNQLKEVQPNIKENINIEKTIVNKKSGLEKIAEEILYFMMNSPVYIKMFQTKIGVFPTKDQRMIANEIIYYYEKNKDINLADFITYAETINLKQEILDIISNVNINDLSEEYMLELLDSFRIKIKRQKELNIKEQLKNELDENKKIALLEELTSLKRGSVEDEGN